MGFLENLLNRYTPRMPGKPVFAVIDTETTGFNKRYDRIIELAAVRADSHFNPVDSWHTLLNPDGKAIKNSHIHGITNDMVISESFAGHRREPGSRTSSMNFMDSVPNSHIFYGWKCLCDSLVKPLLAPYSSA